MICHVCGNEVTPEYTGEEQFLLSKQITVSVDGGYCNICRIAIVDTYNDDTGKETYTMEASDPDRPAINKLYRDLDKN